MSKCPTCQKKFLLFKVNRTKCTECGEGYCVQCLQRANGLKFYCNICFILNTRPANRAKVMAIRSKEVKLYLSRRKVSTEHCLEKEDLVNRFLCYVDLEQRLPKNGTKKNYINGLFSSFTNSMPTLLEQNRRPEPPPSFSRNIHEQPTSSQRVSSHNSPEHFTQPQTTENIVQPQFTDQNTATTNARENTATADIETSTSSKPTIRKLIRLADIENVEDIHNLAVKQLKELLFINRIDFKGCVEKEELIKKVINLWIDTKNSDPENLTGEDLCKICMDAPLNSVLLECGHIATCIDCGKQLTECPICRQYIVRVVHTFKA